MTAGIAGASLILLRKNDFSISPQEMYHEDDLLEHANDYLLNARREAGEIVKDAEEKSNLLIEEAGKKLSLVKEKTDELHNKISEGRIEEAMKIKNELENIIVDFKSKLN